MPLYTSNRMVHLASNGCLVMTPRTPHLEEIFSSDEVVYFDTVQDCEDKIRYYLAHTEEAIKIAKAGQKRAHSDYDAKVISSMMLKKIWD